MTAPKFQKEEHASTLRSLACNIDKRLWSIHDFGDLRIQPGITRVSEPLQYVPHEKLSLKSHPEFNEAWLHDRICDTPEVLGLGVVRVIDRERVQAAGGRLDLLLADEENSRRFEVEVMLGATDPSHIIRTIEYWDIERRRFPGYDHVAVIIAEDITTRFLNVLSLMSGSIPLIAIQLNALKVGSSIVLNFVQVLDVTDLRRDEDEPAGAKVDRAYWEQSVGADLVQMCDSVLKLINQAARYPHELSYMQQYIGLKSNGVANNFVSFWFKKSAKQMYLGFRTSQAKQLRDRFEKEGVTVKKQIGRRLEVVVTGEQLVSQQALIKEAIDTTVAEET